MIAGKELEQILRQTLAQFPDLRLALLFGSHARGTAREDSDVDVAVDAPGELLGTIGARVSEATGKEVDVLPLKDAHIPLLRQLVEHSIVVHEGAPGALAIWRSHALTELETDGPNFDRMRDAWLTRVAEKGLSG